jgi:hypothetical protein
LFVTIQHIHHHAGAASHAGIIPLFTNKFHGLQQNTPFSPEMTCYFESGR